MLRTLILAFMSTAIFMCFLILFNFLFIYYEKEYSQLLAIATTAEVDLNAKSGRKFTVGIIMLNTLQPDPV